MVFSSEVVSEVDTAAAGVEEALVAAVASVDLEAEASAAVDLAEAGRNSEKTYIKKEKATCNLLFLCSIKFLSNHQGMCFCSTSICQTNEISTRSELG